MGIYALGEITSSETQWDAGTLVNVDGVFPGDLVLLKQTGFTETVLEAAEHSATGTVPTAIAVFTAKNVTGLTKANSLLKIDLQCSDWSALNGASDIEITSFGDSDTEEWALLISGMGLSIPSTYQTFYFDLSAATTTGGELDVTAINYIRWYAYFSTSQTIAWRNAELVRAYYDDGYRESPVFDLSAIAGTVSSSSISWTATLNGGSITFGTRYSLDGGTTWSAWSDFTTSGSIPNLAGKDVSNGRLQCRQKLYTNTGYSKGLYTPDLHNYIVTVNGAAHSKSFTVVATPSARSAKVGHSINSPLGCAVNARSARFERSSILSSSCVADVQGINVVRSIDFPLDRIVDEKTFYGQWKRVVNAPSIWTRVTR